MVKLAAGLYFFVLSAAALARPAAPDRLLVHERRDAIPNGFKYVGKANPDTTLELRIALVQGDPAGLEAALYDVSTPGSKNYRKHLSKAQESDGLSRASSSPNLVSHCHVQVEAFVAPKAESAQAVKAWLAKNNVTATTISPAGDWMSVKLPVAKANAMLDTTFSQYIHEKTNTTMIRTMQYSVPDAVKQHLAAIHPTTAFTEPISSRAGIQTFGGAQASKDSSQRAKVSAAATSHTTLPRPVAAVDDSCKGLITPECLQSLYNIPSAPASSNQSNLFVTIFGQEAPTQNDLQLFLGEFRQDNGRRPAEVVLGGIDGSTGGFGSTGTLEASLDLQYTAGLATEVPVFVLSVGSQNSDGIDGFLDAINTLLGQDPAPQVLTTSFGFNEPGLPAPIATNLCNAYAQLGARGTTVLFASTAASREYSPRRTVLRSSRRSLRRAPCGTTNTGPEVAASLSAGGFSTIFARPAYQNDSVNAYLHTLGNTNSGLFNPSGRAYPDIAAQAQNFQVFINGQVVNVDGTSAASPTVASVIALVNDAILEGGGQPVGFLNPFLYSSAAGAMNDITQGSNPGCGTNGFPAAQGWDPVTGLGTPDFNKLLASAKQKPPVLGGFLP
ncbi:subtilisin-like protein [Cubamyces sp. BRFM 1775]|nr:subtilisin-like protein [Cubamyces sp. BRFM 1775]